MQRPNPTEAWRRSILKPSVTIEDPTPLQSQNSILKPSVNVDVEDEANGES